MHQKKVKTFVEREYVNLYYLKLPDTHTLTMRKYKKMNIVTKEIYLYFFLAKKEIIHNRLESIRLPIYCGADDSLATRG